MKESFSICFVSYVDENIKPHTNARSSFDQRAVFAGA